jgi:putative flippase GtrA
MRRHESASQRNYQTVLKSDASLGGVISVWRLHERLYDKLRKLRGWILEVTRFGAVGFAGLLVTDGGANLLHYKAGVDKLAAVAISAVAASVMTFLGSRYWTFRDRHRAGAGQETVLYFALNSVGIGISAGCVGLTYPLGLKGGLSYNIALNGGNAVAAGFRYWSYRKWVWPSKQVGAQQSQTQQVRAGGFAISSRFRVAGRKLDAFLLPRLELVRFAIVGGCAFVVTMTNIYVLHTYSAIGPVMTNFIAATTGAAVSYLGHRNWTFRHRRRANPRREGILYATLNGVSLAILLAWLGFATITLDLHGITAYYLLVLIGIGLGTLFRYWSYRKWVWPMPPAAAR